MIFSAAALLLVVSTAATGTGDVRHRSLNYFEDAFADGLETEYNDYAQAWRYLGIYIDCDAEERQERRKLEDGDEDNENDEEGDEEGDEEEEEDNQDEEEEEEEGDQAEEDDKVCGRYLLWGAYVDESYEGAGLSEYKIFNAETSKWDATACEAGDSSRCVKMDCHRSGSSFKHLGYFRQDNPVEFLQLLAQGQGSCSFKNGEGDAMAAEWLPNECTQVNDQNLYFDLKPMAHGNIGLGLYVDAACSLEYDAGDVDVESLLTGHYGQAVYVEDTLASINSGLGAFKSCNPCRTFDFSYQPAENGDDEDQNDDGANNEEDPNNLNFVCVDANGNEGVNQCQMFAENSEISKATFSDITLASSQGSTMQSYSGADATAGFAESWGFFILSTMVLLAGICCFCSSAVKWRRVETSANKREPLMGSVRRV